MTEQNSNTVYYVVFSLIILLLSSSITSMIVHAAPIISGTVEDNNGIPLAGVQVSIWRGLTPLNLTVTDANGFFWFDIEQNPLYTMIITGDLNSTPGVDFLPGFYNYSSLSDNNIYPQKPAASIEVVSDFQFVESENIPSNIMYTIIDADSKDPLHLGVYALEFGARSVLNSFFDLDKNILLVPLEEDFAIEVTSSVVSGHIVEDRKFTVDDLMLSSLAQGESFTLNLKPYAISYSQESVFNLIDAVNTTINDMTSLGFYLVSERASLDLAEDSLSESIKLLTDGDYVESYSSCRLSYIELIKNQEHLSYMLADAEASLSIIVSFLSLASIAVAFLLTNKDSTKILGGITLYAISLAILYYTYPGSTVIPLVNYVGLGAASILTALFIATYIPRFLKGREKRGMVPLRNILVPIFSISKRSIRRRQLRFLLTLTSISLLVLSFVSLTSISEGYGVIISRVPIDIQDQGILIRAKDYEYIDTTSLSSSDISSSWLESQDETLLLSTKAENKPQSWRLGSVNEAHIWGFLGLEIENEDHISGIKSALLAGSLPSMDGVAISQNLGEDISVSIGDNILFNGYYFTVEGIFDDNKLTKIKEYDGSDFLPGKLVDLFPEEEYVEYTREACEPSETLFFNIDKVLEIFKADISRISIKVEEGYDANSYAERLALERGFHVYASTVEGIYSMKLGSYLKGKGIQLIIPWGIVILNVVVTMLNSMFERKKEIHILSSLGLNPSQIATIFIAEASIIGLTAGGIGYLAGMSLYKVLPVIGFNIGVQQKVSAAWSLASVGISVASVLAGAFAALRGSVVITPSLTRKWRIDSGEGGYLTPWEVTLPVKLISEEVDPFVDYMVSKLNELENDPNTSTSYIRIPYRTDDHITITFVHRELNTTGGFYTKNSLVIEKGTEDITVKLKSYGERDWVHKTGTLVRMIAMRWSTSSERAGYQS